MLQWLLQPRSRIVTWFALGLMAVLFIRLFIFVANGAEAEPAWLNYSHECGDRIAKRLGCSSCSAQWPEIAACTIKRIRGVAPDTPDDWVIAACVAAVRSRLGSNMPGSTDRITPMVKCATRK